ncbi:MAG: hypothetical protein IJ902_00740 [Prevotella sp.]|nr:hypothetical protein [Prevotella sp.]
MKKNLMTYAAGRLVLTVSFCCAMTTVVNAQNAMEDALKQVEQKTKLADKNPKNGKMQYQAAMACIADVLGEKKDFDRAISYANRALKIAQEHPVPQDTLKGLSSNALGLIYMAKQDFANCDKYMLMAVDAFQEELGRYDPLTNGAKLTFGYFLLGTHQPLRAYPMILDAFVSNDMAPQDKRIENLMEANIIQSWALEQVIADMTMRFKHAMPMIHHEGKTYLIVQTQDWNIERPLVNWMVPNLLRTEDERSAYEGDNLILCDGDFHFTVIPDEEVEKYNHLEFSFIQALNDPKHLLIKDGSAHLWFMSDQAYNELLKKFREFKAANK